MRRDADAPEKNELTSRRAGSLLVFECTGCIFAAESPGDWKLPVDYDSTGYNDAVTARAHRRSFGCRRPKR
jgi:hypothetical protein